MLHEIIANKHLYFSTSTQFFSPLFLTFQRLPFMVNAVFCDINMFYLASNLTDKRYYHSDVRENSENSLQYHLLSA